MLRSLGSQMKLGLGYMEPLLCCHFSLSYTDRFSPCLYILPGKENSVICINVLLDGWSPFKVWGFFLRMKSMSVQSLYPFSGNGELPDVLFRMEKYSFDL